MHLVKKVKDDKQQFELFAAAVLFKMRYVNSCIGTVTNKTVRQTLHCKHNVAQRILEGMQDSPFFIVAGGKAFVPTFKSSDRKVYYVRNYRYTGTADYCMKMKVREGYTLREMKKALRELLLENMVRAKQTQQVKSSGKKNPSCVTTDKDLAITLGQLSKCFGLGRSSAWYYMKRLVDNKIVSKTRMVAECVISELNDVTLAQWLGHNPGRPYHVWHNLRSGGWSAWANHGCIYHIIDRDTYESFKYVIWNHRKRLVPQVND